MFRVCSSQLKGVGLCVLITMESTELLVPVMGVGVGDRQKISFSCVFLSCRVNLG